jgi:LPS O-antigen subunit length determinant protein (WzzB/FepE family)
MQVSPLCFWLPVLEIVPFHTESLRYLSAPDYISRFTNGTEESNSARVWQKSFDEQGYHDATVPVARQPVTFRIRADDFNKFAEWDPSFVWSEFPAAADVLSIHGLADNTVPP